MNLKIIAVVVSLSAPSAVALAQDVKESAPGALERRLERIEKAVERLESKMSGRQSRRGGGMMEGCRDMMGGRMGGGMMDRNQPNEQWRSPDGKR